MKNSLVKRLAVAVILTVLFITSILAVLTTSVSADDEGLFGGTLTATFEKTEAVEKLLATSNYYAVVKHKQLGGTHYAYTDALSEAKGGGADMLYEYNFEGGSQLVILSVMDNGNGTVSTYEKQVLRSSNGVVRDPSVSTDGTKLLYSYKKDSNDDFHIYEIDLTSDKFTTRQLTFGSGRSDTEPQYLANGNIVFSSNRATQTVDCWITPVSNLYIMDKDGNNIRRVGYDQVHTTYPTVTSDGRVIYTRWDYNDRTQMYVQSIFQMFADGTYQTEVWGNDANFPTTLLHSREIPGATGKYISIASGHHVKQIGKLCVVDTTMDRNDKSAIAFPFPDANTNYSTSVDGYGQQGRVYKYPYAIDETTFLVSSVDSYTSSNAAFSIYLCDATKNFSSAIQLVKGSSTQPASQIVPIKISKIFDRPSMVDYSKSTGTYYVANVYEGEGMKGVAFGSAKYLRVVEIVYRSSSVGATISSGSGTGDPFSPVSTGNGSWDVKAVLGVVPVEEDGSVMFSIPSDTPVYFQLLDENGCVIQTMRSWSTLMPGETFSCVGCHEDKNTAPLSGGGVTMAMKKGVQTLQPDLWMEGMEEYADFDPYKDDSIGFSYPNTVQKIFDKSCISCHSNLSTSLEAINANSALADKSIDDMGYLISLGDEWQYEMNGKTGVAHAPFGSPTASSTDINTKWTGNSLTLKKDFFFTQYNKEVCTVELQLKYKGNVTVKVGNTTLYTGNSTTRKTETITLTASQLAGLSTGTNTMTVTVTDSSSAKYLDAAFRAYVPTGRAEFVSKGSTWKYMMSTGNTAPSDWYTGGFDDSSWKSGKAPFGDRGGQNTSWTGSENYIWIRQEFDLTAEQAEGIAKGSVNFNIFYDDTMKIYINGTMVMSKSGWNDSYEIIDLDSKYKTVFKEGKNVIAISLMNTAGGRQIDLSLNAVIPVTTPSSDIPFSLIGDPVIPDSNRTRRAFPLSYLFLTGSTPTTSGNQIAGTNWISRSSGSYLVKFINTMSRPDAIPAYYSGSTKSPLIAKLRSGHGNLTDGEIRAIACWIDLAVPCFGSYDEGEQFSEEEVRYYEERVNKRHFYDVWDRYSKMAISGTLPAGSVSVSYTNTSGNTTTQTGEGYLIMYVSGKYNPGDTVTVKVTGSKYVAISMNERQGESLLYLPNGEFTYTIPANMEDTYNLTYRSSGTVYYRNNTIFVRIPTAKELSEERNLAVNPYDISSQSAAYPHVSADSVKDGEAGFEARTAIDGFTSNKKVATVATTGYPYQAWVPSAASGNTFTVNFGREVVANSLRIKLRADSTDTHLLSVKLTFSDGSSMDLHLWNTAEFMAFDLGGKKISSITLSDFEKAVSNKTFAITELEVYGTEG